MSLLPVSRAGAESDRKIVAPGALAACAHLVDLVYYLLLHDPLCWAGLLPPHARAR